MKNKGNRWPSIEDVLKSPVGKLNAHLEAKNEQQAQKKSKYKNTRTEVDGIKFDSEKEARRYKDLLLLRKAGKIGNLRLQVEYELNPGGTHSLKYIADFVYVDAETGKEVVEDVKGSLTTVYKKKRRLMLKVHNIKILET
jgi:hypothetical protein